MNNILYSTGCPKCQVLEKKLQQSSIEYSVVDDVAVMEEKGFMELPMFETDGEVMTFIQAVSWLNNK